MTLDTSSYDNPLHPRFTNDADGAKSARFDASFRWLHAEAVQKNNGNLDRAMNWILRWRSQPDDVEAALMLAVAQLIKNAKDDQYRRLVRSTQRRHERRMMATSHLLESAA